MENILHQLKAKEIDKEKFIHMVSEDDNLIDLAFKGVYEKPATVKYGSSKALLVLSEKFPEKLIDYFNDVIKLLDHRSNPIKYAAIFMIANVGSVDCDLFKKIHDKYFNLLKGPVLIPAANVAKASLELIKSNEISNNIIEELLKVNSYDYETPTCKDIVIGKVIITFNKALKEIDPIYYHRIVNFVKPQIHNNRPSTAKNAEKLLKKINKLI